MASSWISQHWWIILVAVLGPLASIVLIAIFVVAVVCIARRCCGRRRPRDPTSPLDTSGLYVNTAPADRHRDRDREREPLLGSPSSTGSLDITMETSPRHSHSHNERRARRKSPKLGSRSGGEESPSFPPSVPTTPAGLPLLHQFPGHANVQFVRPDLFEDLNLLRPHLLSHDRLTHLSSAGLGVLLGNSSQEKKQHLRKHKQHQKRQKEGEGDGGDDHDDEQASSDSDIDDDDFEGSFLVYDAGLLFSQWEEFATTKSQLGDTRTELRKSQDALGGIRSDMKQRMAIWRTNEKRHSHLEELLHEKDDELEMKDAMLKRLREQNVTMKNDLRASHLDNEKLRQRQIEMEKERILMERKKNRSSPVVGKGRHHSEDRDQSSSSGSGRGSRDEVAGIHIDESDAARASSSASAAVSAEEKEDLASKYQSLVQSMLQKDSELAETRQQSQKSESKLHSSLQRVAELSSRLSLLAEERDDLRQEVLKLKSRGEDFESRMVSSQSEVRKLAGELKSRESDRLDMKKAADESSMEREVLESEIVASKSRMVELEGSLELAQNESASVKGHLERAQAKLSEAQAEAARLRTEMSMQAVTLEKKEEDLRSLRVSHEEAQSRVSDMESSLRHREVEGKDLSQRESLLKSQIAAATKSRKEVEQRCLGLQRQMHELQSDLQSAKSSRETLERENKQNLHELLERIQVLTEDLEKSNLSVRLAQEECESHKDAMQTISPKLEKLRQTNVRLLQQLRESEESCQHFRDVVSEKGKELERKARQYETTQRKLERTNMAFEDAKTRLAKNSETCRDLQMKSSEAQSVLVDTKTKLEEAQADCLAESKRADGLSARLQEEVRLVGELNQERQALRSVVERKSSEAEKARAQVGDLRRQIHGLEIEVENETSLVQELTHTVEGNEEKLNVHREEVAARQQALLEKEKECSEVVRLLKSFEGEMNLLEGATMTVLEKRLQPQLERLSVVESQATTFRSLISRILSPEVKFKLALARCAEAQSRSESDNFDAMETPPCDQAVVVLGVAVRLLSLKAGQNTWAHLKTIVHPIILPRLVAFTTHPVVVSSSLVPDCYRSLSAVNRRRLRESCPTIDAIAEALMCLLVIEIRKEGPRRRRSSGSTRSGGGVTASTPQRRTRRRRRRSVARTQAKTPGSITRTSGGAKGQ